MSPPRRRVAKPRVQKYREATLALIAEADDTGLPKEGTPLFAEDGRPAGTFTRGVKVECGCTWRRWDPEREVLYDQPVRWNVAPCYVGRLHNKCGRRYRKVRDG